MLFLETLKLSPVKGLPAGVNGIILGLLAGVVITIKWLKYRDWLSTSTKVILCIKVNLIAVILCYLMLVLACTLAGDTSLYTNKGFTAYDVQINTESEGFKNIAKSKDILMMAQGRSKKYSKDAKFYIVDDKLYFRKNKQKKELLIPDKAETQITTDIISAVNDLYNVISDN